MKCEPSRLVFTLADCAQIEKRQSARQEKDRKSVFMETLFDLLTEDRRTVITFISQKLDKRRRRYFREDLEKCSNAHDECRCVKTYLRHLPVRDFNALFSGVRRMIAGKVDSVAYPGEKRPEARLAKFARTFRLSESDVDDLMMLFLLAS